MAKYAEIRIELHATAAGGRSNPLDLSEDRPGFYRPHLRALGAAREIIEVEIVQGPAEPVPPGGGTNATMRVLTARGTLDDGAEFEMLEGERVVGVVRITRSSRAQRGI